jgi:DNA-binding NarL/FixJ family response regulator
VITLVLADDSPAVRRHVRALLEIEKDLRIVGEAAGGLEAIELVKRLHPDVLVLDMVMDGVNGIEVAREVAKNVPKTGIVIYSMYNDKAYVIEALQAGAKAYILKGSDFAELVRAVREAKAGRVYLPAPLSQYQQPND